MSTYEISKSSLLSLKAEILRKQQEIIKAKADNEVKIKIIKSNTPLEIKNKGIEERQKNDISEEDEDLLKKSRSVLEAKSKLYDKLSSGSFTKEEAERNKRFLVRFDKKSGIRNPSLIDFEDSEPEKSAESDDDRYYSDEDDSNKDPGEKWVDYTDCLGRTRKCLQKDLEYLMSKDEELKKTVVEKNKTNSSDEKESGDKDGGGKSNEENVTENQESELLSSDMRRELLRQQWEQEEEELRNKSNIHYQDILFGEARTHGVGYYNFSKDEEERAKQQEALKKLREETEQKQRTAQELKAKREKQLAARIKAAKNRRRARLGLPPEEDEIEPEVQQPEISEEEKKKQEELKRSEEAKERLLEEARKKHLRPWDIGKEGVKEHYVMSQEEWTEKKREERPTEFAPPQSYKKRKFRSTPKLSNLEETNKSLKFTTKKSNRKNRNSATSSKCFSSNTNDVDYKTDTVLSKDNFHQGVAFEPTPIENLIDADFDDPLLSDYNRVVQNSDNEESDSRKRGVEIPPPSTFEYYGPTDGKRPRPSKSGINIENSIEAGLKYLRKQVEDKQIFKSGRNDFTSPF